MTDLKTGILLWSQAATWPEMLDAAKRVDRLGYDHLWTWDHLYAIFGDPYQPIFEGWTSLAAWAMATDQTRLGLLVGANTFRNPGLTAKTAETLDHISDGRAILGIGGAWFELEHTAHGIDFGTGFGQRLDWLDEAVGAMRAVLDGGVGDLGARRALRLRRPAAPAPADPEAPADHDRRQRREEDAAHRREVRRHVERHGNPGGHDPQGRGPARPLRRGRSRHRRDRVHARREAHHPRLGGRGRPGLEGGDGAQPHADGRRRGRQHVLEWLTRADRRPPPALRRARASTPSSRSSRRPTTSRRSSASSARSSRSSTGASLSPGRPSGSNAPRGASGAGASCGSRRRRSRPRR